MSDCPACDEARANRWCGAYRSECIECKARMLAHSPAHYDSAKARKILPRYRDALMVVFGERWEDGHRRVKAWAERQESQA